MRLLRSPGSLGSPGSSRSSRSPRSPVVAYERLVLLGAALAVSVACHGGESGSSGAHAGVSGAAGYGDSGDASSDSGTSGSAGRPDTDAGSSRAGAAGESAHNPHDSSAGDSSTATGSGDGATGGGGSGSGSTATPASSSAAAGGDPVADRGRSGGSAGVAGESTTVTELPGAGAGGATPTFEVGQSCSQLLELRCAGAHQKQVLLCDTSGVWQEVETCSSTQNCDRSSAACAEIVPQCQGNEPGFVFCAGQELRICGPDLVTVETSLCWGACVSGACEEPGCQDGIVQDDEECDDGNDVPADGCEPDCHASAVVALTAGASHTCALLAGGHVRCWGGNDDGQLGLGTTAAQSDREPYELGPIALGEPVTQVAAGGHHTCAVTESGALRCWGDNTQGQLGLEHTDAIGDDELPTAEVSTVDLQLDVLEVTAGGDTTCALLSDHTVSCWGGNEAGQLGLGSPEDQISTPSLVPLGEEARSVSTSGLHTCAILDTNQILCWGNQLSLGTTEDIGDDELASDGEYISFGVTEPYYAIITGGLRSCALATGRTSHNCWGYNGDAGLGLGSPKPFDFGLYPWDQHPVEFLVAGVEHMCVALWSEQFRCWGWNDSGQLGLGTTSPTQASMNLPAVDLGLDTAVDSPAYAVSGAAGEFHTCVLLSDGRVRCWGLNDQGQLGYGYASESPNYIGGSPDELPADLEPVHLFPTAP
jgi:cysteine-rich repeat protein